MDVYRMVAFVDNVKDVVTASESVVSVLDEVVASMPQGVRRDEIRNIADRYHSALRRLVAAD